jgi:hypothetical protein
MVYQQEASGIGVIDEREARIAKLFALYFEADVCTNCFGNGYFWVQKESPAFEMPGVKNHRTIELCKECLGTGQSKD